MARPIQNLWPETRALAVTLTLYAVEDAGAFYELVLNGTPDATLVSPNGYVALDPTMASEEFRFVALGTSPIGIIPA
jgi:hypothetical protein